MKYLLYIAKIYSIPIYGPFFDYLKTTEHDYAFYVSEKIKKVFPGEWPKDKIINTIGECIKFNPDFVIVSGNHVDLRLPGIKAQIFHGIGVEKKSHYKIRHLFDVYFTSGPFVTERFEKLRRKHKYFSVIESGWPKVDTIINYTVPDLRKRFDITPNKKIILYAPTFSKKMESSGKILPKLSKLIKEDEVWFVKFHELMDREYVKSIGDYPSLIFIKGYDITPYLYLADVMVSDTSSVIYEFMLLDKPVVTMNTQSRKDKGIDVNNIADLRKGIDRSLKNPQEFHDNRMKHIAEINPRRDGKIAESICRSLINIRKKNLLPNHKKPINLFRKLNIAYDLKFRKGRLR